MRVAETVTFYTNAGDVVRQPQKYRPQGKRSIAQIQQDREIISRYYLKGYGYEEINDEIEKVQGYRIALPRISETVQSLLKEWKANSLRDIGEWAGRELERLSVLEGEYWRAWQRSLEPLEDIESESNYDQYVKIAKDEAVREGSAIEEGEAESRAERMLMRDKREGAGRVVIREKTVRYKKTGYGEVRFLEGVERCIMQRCKILGIGQPVQQNNTLVINWRKEAEAAGVNPEVVVDGLIERFLLAADSGGREAGDSVVDGGGESRSMG